MIKPGPLFTVAIEIWQGKTEIKSIKGIADKIDIDDLKFAYDSLGVFIKKQKKLLQ